MAEILRVEDLAEFVQRTIEEVNKGVAGARGSGIVADLPREIAFQTIVVTNWQALDAVTTTTQQQSSTQGGGNTQTTSGTSVRIGNNAHNQTDEKTSTETTVES